MAFALSFLQLLLGIALLFAGGELFVAGSVALSLLFGIPQIVIGLTVVSFGTSAPELFVSLLSTLQTGGSAESIAVSNVVGSNIFNTLLVAGVTATIRPMPVPQYGQIDLVATGVLGIIFTAAAFTHKHQIVRREGLLLMALYLGYMTWRTVGLTLGS